MEEKQSAPSCARWRFPDTFEGTPRARPPEGGGELTFSFWWDILKWCAVTRCSSKRRRAMSRGSMSPGSPVP